MSVRPTVRSALLVALLLTLLCEGSRIAVAKDIHAKQFGPVEIRGDSPDFEIMIDGRVAARDTMSSFVSIVKVYPDEANARWLVLSHNPGASSCDSSYSVVDLTKTPPSLSARFGNCYSMNDIEGSDQIVFSLGGREVWAFDAKGLVEVPKLPLNEHVRIGVDAYKAGNFSIALRHLWPYTDQQNPETAHYMGLMRHLGKGVSQDYKEAMSYYKKAAELEYPQAFFRIGVLHANGRGVPKDMAEANRWYRKAADHGDGLGQYNLALNLMTGSGVAKDLKGALLWFVLAEPRVSDPKDREGARKNIAFLEGKLTAEEIADARARAATWAPAETKMFEMATDLRAWVGKHPWDKVKGRPILKVAALDVRLRVLLGDETVDVIGEI